MISDILYAVGYAVEYAIGLVALFVTWVVIGYIFLCTTLKCIGHKAKVNANDWMAYVPFAQDVYKLRIINAPWWKLFFFGGCGFVCLGLISLLLCYISLIIAAIWVVAWLIVAMCTRYLYYKELFKGFHFDERLAWGSLFGVNIFVEILIAYKNDIYWGELPKVDPVPTPMPSTPVVNYGYIYGLSGTHQNAKFKLRDNNIVWLGRDGAKCQVAFNDASDTEVSHTHCSIRYQDSYKCFIVTDYSKNGTYVVAPGYAGTQGVRLQSNMPTPVSSGSTIYLGSNKNSFRLG